MIFCVKIVIFKIVWGINLLLCFYYSDISIELLCYVIKNVTFEMDMDEQITHKNTKEGLCYYTLCC